MNKTLKNKMELETNTLKIIREKRPPCPFYGFDHVYMALFDTKGNQCSLIEGSRIPCQMEIWGYKPNWDECYLNTKKNKKRVSEVLNARVFPDELKPGHPWGGMSFKDWRAYVMKKH